MRRCIRVVVRVGVELVDVGADRLVDNYGAEDVAICVGDPLGGGRGTFSKSTTSLLESLAVLKKLKDDPATEHGVEDVLRPTTIVKYMAMKARNKDLHSHDLLIHIRLEDSCQSSWLGPRQS